MTTFTTPGPVTLRVRFEAGTLAVSASDRADTTVDVTPSRPGNDHDVQHAAATVVEQHGDEIVVLAPDVKRFFGRPSLRVTVAVPTGSAAIVHVASASTRLTGRFGDVDVTSASGDVVVDHAGDTFITVASGDASCARTDGSLTVKSASGDVRFGEVAGRLTASTASGDVSGARVDGDAELRTASGDIVVDDVTGSVAGRTASGDIRLGRLRRGRTELETASGDVHLGIAAGTAAWLDVRSITGDVESTLDAAGPPADDDETVSIHARTLSGDLSLIHI